MARLTLAVPNLVRRIGQRRVLVLGDQAVSSLSNIVVTILVARALSPALFGAFGVAMVVYQLALGVVRAVVGEPWLSAHSAEDAGARSRATADLLHAAAAAGAVISLMTLAAALLAGGLTLRPLVALAVLLPLLVGQDALRFVTIVDRPGLALASDFTWLVVTVVAVVVTPGASPEAFVVLWAVGGIAGLAVLLVTLDARWRSGRAVRWFSLHRRMAASFLGEFISARAAGHVTVLALGWIAGLSAVGAVRAAQVFYGPLNTLFSGAYLALVPDGVRLRDRPARLRRLMTLASVVVTTAAFAWMLVGQFMPDAWGEVLFNATWGEAADLMLPMGLAVVIGSLTTGAFAGIRALQATKTSLRARLLGLPPQLIGCLGGAALGSAVGYAYGFALANLAVTSIWWVSFLGLLRQIDAGAVVVPEAAESSPVGPAAVNG